jgi:predicted ester cyclase
MLLGEGDMTRADIEQRLAAHRAAFLRRNAEEIAAQHALDGTHESPAHGLITGRAEILAVYKYWYGAFPDFSLTWDSAIIDPPRAAIFWTFEGTAAGPFFGDVKPGTRVNMQGAGEFVFGDDGIQSVRHIFDFSALLVSTGVLKIKPAC